MDRTPLRTSLFVLTLVGILPLAILAAAGLFALFESQKESAQGRSLETARALAAAVQAQLGDSISSLQLLASSAALERDDIATFGALVSRASRTQRGWRLVSLALPDGRHLYNTSVGAGEALPEAPLQPASFEQIVRTHAPAVGSLIQGRLGYAFPVRVPVMRDGTLRYVLTAAVDPQSVVDLIQGQRAAQGWFISVFDADGVRIARSFNQEHAIGTRGTPSLEALIASGAEGTGLTTTMEGDRLFTAFTRLRPSGWTIVTGMPQSMLYGPAVQSVLVLGAAVLLSIVVGLAAATVFARKINVPIARLREAAHRMGEGGEPHVPQTRIREIHDVGVALATAARARAAIEYERELLLLREQEARGEAEAANRAKDQFLAMLGHELRNPLAALSSASALIQAKPDEAMRARANEVIHRQVRHLSRLTDDLLDAARALLGKIELHRQPVDLGRVVSQALQALAASGRARNHRWETGIDEVWVDGDEVRLDQVAMNLLVNALKYTPAGRTIRVRTRREGDCAVLVVADEGVGLSRSLAARVFDPFVQGERTLDRAEGGLGIGLTLVRHLAELHGGSARAHSDGEDRGSEFVITLPAIERPAHLAAKPRAGALGARRILLVEDNEDARETLRAVLEIEGHRVRVVGEGVEGLEMALADPPDVALVDLGLPGIDGYELARRFRAARPDAATLLIALTGYGTADDQARAIAAGFDAHFAKPLDFERFTALLRDTALEASPSSM